MSSHNEQNQGSEKRKMKSASKQKIIQPVDKNLDQVYQVSTMVSLLDGIYDGDFYMSEAKEHGDFGIGTFNRLDGEPDRF